MDEKPSREALCPPPRLSGRCWPPRCLWNGRGLGPFPPDTDRLRQRNICTFGTHTGAGQGTAVQGSALPHGAQGTVPKPGSQRKGRPSLSVMLGGWGGGCARPGPLLPAALCRPETPRGGRPTQGTSPGSEGRRRGRGELGPLGLGLETAPGCSSRRRGPTCQQQPWAWGCPRDTPPFSAKGG